MLTIMGKIFFYILTMIFFLFIKTCEIAMGPMTQCAITTAADDSFCGIVFILGKIRLVILCESFAADDSNGLSSFIMVS